ncbi:hypothetical protein ICN30_02360 [Polynucleobacter sp. 31A-FELB]|uniref:hypothetical protein n=1 Tax=Polynucleobacter sp. 31A-FELB TaxID=2689096 RepID=UPI001C0D07B4|nr:hypothetical protein [Polynucleobacter sp. 31A-FELB]MBU3586676.1 hypothetical protein [Polynucleobacter sp. 31A-FELB]
MNFLGIIKSPLLACVAICVAALPQSTLAASFFFPDMNPSFVKGDPPDWLHDGRGNDGYLTISSEVIPVSSCTQMASRSFWGSDKTQLVLSVVTQGFKGKLDKLEIPIATFDGREGGSECASLSTTPLSIVPMTVLGTYSIFNPGALSLVLNVRSSSDSNQDFIGSAKLLLGAAAIVATGGSAAAIGGISATVGNSVVGETQKKANSLLQGMVDAKVPVTFNWSELRKGIRAVEIHVYKADQSVGSLTDKQILQLQKDPKSEKQLLFTVKLEFQFFRSVFYPTVSNIEGLASRENLSSEYILNFQMPGSGQNFMQILNSSAPSLLQRIAKAEGPDLAKACSSGFTKLKTAGLDDVDSAIVMKSFVDEAKGSDAWYANPALLKNCFSQVPSIQKNLELIYGLSVAPSKQVIEP